MNAFTSSVFAEPLLAGASLAAVAFLFLWLEYTIALTLGQATPPRRQHHQAPLLAPYSAIGLLKTQQAGRWSPRRLALGGKAWKPGL